MIYCDLVLYPGTLKILNFFQHLQGAAYHTVEDWPEKQLMAGDLGCRKRPAVFSRMGKECTCFPTRFKMLRETRKKLKARKSHLPKKHRIRAMWSGKSILGFGAVETWV